MKKALGTLCGLLIWSGLLVLQGTPSLTEDIAAEAVITNHPTADVYQVKETTIQDTAVYEVAYIDEQSADQGIVDIAVDNGKIISPKA